MAKVKPINIDMKALGETSRSNMSLPKADLETKALQARNLNATRAKETKDTGQSFGAAFAAARKSGATTFKWKGGTYGTKMKGEDKPKPAAAKPAANPYSSKTSMGDIKRNLDMNNSQMSSAQLRNFAGGLNRDADNSAADRMRNPIGRTAAATGTAVTPSKMAANVKNFSGTGFGSFKNK
jgi:hypothetical protein